MEGRAFLGSEDASSGPETSPLSSTISSSLSRNLSSTILPLPDPEVGQYHLTPDGSWMEQGYNIASVGVGAAMIGLGLGFIIVTNATSALRKDPAKWLQQTAAYGVTLYTANTFLDPHLPWQASGICEFFWPLTWSCMYLIYLALMLVTVERTIAVWNEDPGVPAIQKIAAAICIGVVAASSVALAYGITFGIGTIGAAVTPEGLTVCADNDDLANTGDLDYAHAIAHGMLALVLLIPTSVCIGRMCRSRVCVSTNPFIIFDSDKVMPVLVGNTILVFTVVVDIILKQVRPDVFWKIEPFGLIIMLALWIGWDGEVRAAYARICCPCCCGDGDKNETIGLLENKEDKMRDDKRQKYDVVTYNSQ